MKILFLSLLLIGLVAVAVTLGPELESISLWGPTLWVSFFYLEDGDRFCPRK